MKKEKILKDKIISSNKKRGNKMPRNRNSDNSWIIILAVILVILFLIAFGALNFYSPKPFLTDLNSSKSLVTCYDFFNINITLLNPTQNAIQNLKIQMNYDIYAFNLNANNSLVNIPVIFAGGRILNQYNFQVKQCNQKGRYTFYFNLLNENGQIIDTKTQNITIS